MMMKSRTGSLALLTLIAFLLQACATGAPYQKDSQLGFSQSFWEGRHFIQNNQIVNRKQVMSALEANPKIQPVVSSVPALEVGGALFGAGGGFMLGYGLVSLGRSDGGEPVLIATGAASILIAVLFENAIRDKLNQAVELHNADLKSEIKNTPAIPKKKGVQLKILPSGLALIF